MTRKVWTNIDGTSSSSFSVGLDGVTFYQGDTTPAPNLGEIGDVYILRSNSPNLLQKGAGGWVEIEGRFLRQTVARGSTAAIGNVATYIGITAGSGNTTLTLPPHWMGKQITIKNETSAGATTISGASIDGQASYVINQSYGSVTLVWAGEWSVVRHT